MKLFTSQRGYTLLFAVLTATLVLGVTVFILSVSRKQFALSATARDSMTAFYAADAGIECAALVLDAPTIDISQLTPGDINCNGQAIAVPQGTDYSQSHPELVLTGFDPDEPFIISPPLGSKIYMSLKKEDGMTTYGCVLYTIYQGIGEDSGSSRLVIEARGYNLCDDDNQEPDTTSFRTVERGLRLRQL